MKNKIMGAAMSMAAMAGKIERMPSLRYRRPKTSFDSKINRWTGQPHTHERATARRLRQQASIEARRKQPVA